MSGLDLLVEVGTEEIPAGYLAPALEALETRLGRSLADQHLEYETIRTWATPRRIALAVESVAERQPDRETENFGPPVKVAFDRNGEPTKAALGFAQREGVAVSDLIQAETPKGLYLMARKTIPGRPAAEVLAEMIPPLILGLPFPKSMRWGKGETTFVRPIHWLLAVLDGRVMPIAIGAIEAGNISYGHRFLSPGPLEINSPGEYEDKLAGAEVVASYERRRELVEQEILKAAESAGETLTILPDPGLVDEVANLVEKPFATLGRFDESFLELPPRIPTTAMREHQRYFALTDDQGNLRPYFIAVNNTRARDMKVVAKGHERVLQARLEDARFYFKEDRKTTLEAKQEKLKRVVFHTLLGTSWEKVERFSKVAGYLSDLLDPAVKPTLLRAAELCKCDLVSGVVEEFPALQGIMGLEYARLDGEPEAVAQAVAEHYLPNRAGGELPRTSAGALLSLADKIDTITGCFSVGLIPTGAADPYALRRQSLGIINIILDRDYRLSLADLVDRALEGLAPWMKKPAEEARKEILEFIRLRLKNQLTSQGASTDGAEAVLSLYFEDPVPAVAKVWAMEEIKKRHDFEDLAVAFKRVVNIIKKFEVKEELMPDRLTEPQEIALYQAASAVEEKAGELAAADDYNGLLQAIVSLKPTVDKFFDDVLVDDPDPAKKANRLALLDRIARLFEMVADFTKITTK